MKSLRAPSSLCGPRCFMSGPCSPLRHDVQPLATLRCTKKKALWPGLSVKEKRPTGLALYANKELWP